MNGMPTTANTVFESIGENFGRSVGPVDTISEQVYFQFVVDTVSILGLDFIVNGTNMGTTSITVTSMAIFCAVQLMSGFVSVAGPDGIASSQLFPGLIRCFPVGSL
jgi:hypothetical protein